jgi:hypothetical protein
MTGPAAAPAKPHTGPKSSPPATPNATIADKASAMRCRAVRKGFMP